MYRLKGYPRCSGDMCLEDEWVCIQCGSRVPVKPVVRLPLVKNQGWRNRSQGIDRPVTTVVR